MRRKDREVADFEGLRNILENCVVCRIGIHDKDGIYIVPLNFGYSYTEEGLELFFHGALEGRKLDGIRENPQVAFEMDCNHRLVEDPDPCEYGFSFQSLMGTGFAEIVSDPQEKIRGLNLLMERQTGKAFSFDERMAASVAVIKITADSFTGKWHR